MITSVRLLGTAVALGAGMLTTSLPALATEVTDNSVGKPGQPGKPGQAEQELSVCRPLSLYGQVTVQCSTGSNGQSADGSADVALDNDDKADADES